MLTERGLYLRLKLRFAFYTTSNRILEFSARILIPFFNKIHY